MSPGPALDLAVVLADTLPAELQKAAGSLSAAETAEAHWGTLFCRWLGELAAELPPPLLRPSYSLGLQICDDAAIASLNETWRGRPGPTDVLAFAAQEGAPPLPAPTADNVDDNDPGEPLELGDIVISLETAARQAEEQGHPLERELCFLASHGLLHLLGWDHPDEASLTAMLARQERLLGSGEWG